MLIKKKKQKQLYRRDKTKERNFELLGAANCQKVNIRWKLMDNND